MNGKEREREYFKSILKYLQSKYLTTIFTSYIITLMYIYIANNVQTTHRVMVIL
jgi:hypothetical protein